MAFLRVNGLRSIEFGNPGSSRNALNDLIFHGNKRATAGTLKWDYEAEGESVETIGERLAILDNNRTHVGTIEVRKVDVVKFSEVPDEFALAEAEGDLDGNDFRASHLDFWSKNGLEITGETKIVLVYFDLVESFI